MRKFFIFMLLCATVLMTTNCHFVAPDADEEAVLIDKPLIIGHGGVRETPVTTGLKWAWWTTNCIYVKIIPVRYDEVFDDIFSNDNTPLDFNTYINIQIEQGKSPVLIQNYGVNWYENNIQVYYRNKTREYVSMYSPFDLISNREILNRIDSLIINDMVNFVEKMSKEKELPIIIKSVTTGVFISKIKI